VRTPTVATTATQEDVIAMIDLTPFESCSPQLREYLEQNVGIQAPGPHRERRKESAPRRRDDIECRRCGRTPAQTGDDVSREAVGFTCSRCLMAEADAYTRPTSAVDIACALDGEHQSDRWANECPVVRRARRPEQGIETSTPYPPTGEPGSASANPHEQRGFETGFYPPSRRQGARRGGRPRKHASDVIARREARRAYRERQRKKS
jgi:hypothetical protein